MGIDDETRELFEQASQTPRAADVFGGELPSEVSAEDLFGGDESLHRRIRQAQGPRLLSQASRAAQKAARFWTPAHVVILVNILVVGAVLAVLLTRHGGGSTASPSQAGQVVLPEVRLSRTTAAVLDESISWQVGQRFLQAGELDKAYYVFRKLDQNLDPSRPEQRDIKDLLALQMGLCLEKMGQEEPAGRLFTQALASRSPAVRALANYSLMFVEMRQRHFAKARIRAYKALGLLPVIQEAFSPNLEADCYFVAAEAMTRQALLLSHEQVDLPGELWTETLRREPLPVMSQAELEAFLGAYRRAMTAGALVPVVKRDENVGVGRQWSATALDAPLEEFLSRFAIEAGQNVIWSVEVKEIKTRPVTLYLPATAMQTIPEIATGGVGLIVEFGTDELVIRDPELYRDLAEQKQLLSREAVSMWRRFVLRYRGDHRTPNAHYAMGLLQEDLDQAAAALAEYKLVYGQFPHSSQAPFSLLNSSRVKVLLRDYRGAQSDLTELLVQYPDCEVVDQASLFLAEATMKAGLYEDAISMFRRVYNLNMGQASRCRAAYGAGQCAFKLKDYDAARRWLIQAIQLMQDATDRRLGPAYLMLGKALVELAEYEQAAVAFQQALGQELATENFAEVALHLAEVERRRGDYVAALEMIGRIPQETLSQYWVSRVLTAKARLLREIGLADTAITLLRRKIEFFADSETRARMTLELARCQMARGDLAEARDDLVDALGRVQDPAIFKEGQILLARISLDLKDYSQAERLCLAYLRRTDTTEAERRTAFELLGRAYEGLSRPQDAARAYAGLIGPAGGLQR